MADAYKILCEVMATSSKIMNSNPQSLKTSNEFSPVEEEWGRQYNDHEKMREGFESLYLACQ